MLGFSNSLPVDSLNFYEGVPRKNFGAKFKFLYIFCYKMYKNIAYSEAREHDMRIRKLFALPLGHGDAS